MPLVLILLYTLSGMNDAEIRFDKASSVIREAGAFLISHAEKRRAVTVKQINDYVTEADRECEKLLITALKEAFPADSFLGEESGVTDGSDGFMWIIDPIDGTVNYMNTFPLYTISVALHKNDRPVFGIVYVPFYDEFFSAMSGEGAFLNGKAIHVTDEAELSHSLALAVPPHRHHDMVPAFMDGYMKLFSVVSDIRSIGSAALSLCYVAAGRCAIYYEWMLKLYDIAAGVIILTEAGGRLKESISADGNYNIAAYAPQAESIIKEISL